MISSSSSAFLPNALDYKKQDARHSEKLKKEFRAVTKPASRSASSAAGSCWKGKKASIFICRHRRFLIKDRYETSRFFFSRPFCLALNKEERAAKETVSKRATVHSHRRRFLTMG